MPGRRCTEADESRLNGFGLGGMPGLYIEGIRALREVVASTVALMGCPAGDEQNADESRFIWPRRNARAMAVKATRTKRIQVAWIRNREALKVRF